MILVRNDPGNHATFGFLSRFTEFNKSHFEMYSVEITNQNRMNQILSVNGTQSSAL